MERNKIAGTIPTELCSLTSLTSLAFGFNQLKGEIPSCIGQLASLELLALHKNDLVGSLPSEMGVSLKKLKRLFLSANILTGDPKDVFNGLARLELLMADTNKFLSKIDDDFLLHHKSLKWLDLSDNDFQMGASIPSHFFSMTNLEVLDLSMNSLRGSFPAISGTNTVLKYLSIFDNDMQGGLSGLTKLRALRHLDISKNYFDGPIRPELAELTDLRLLFLGNNRFIPDHIPKSFLNLTKLEDLSLRHTNRTGPFDPSFLPASLVYLDLGTNQLSGTVPESIGAFSHLEFLMLNDNSNITGALPVSFSNLQKLRAVFLDGTSIGSNVSQVCDLPKFVAPKGNEIAFADCASPSPSPSLCGCCQCCSDAISKNGCSIPFQLNLRSKWSKDFQSLNFKVTNGTVFLNRDYIPPV